MVLIMAPSPLGARGGLEAGLLAKWVHFLSTTESRSKIYRVVQYGAKMTKWSLMQLWGIERQPEPEAALHPQRIHDSSEPVRTSHNPDATGLEKRNQNGSALAKQNGHANPHGPAAGDEDPRSQWRKSVLAALSRVELLFGDARKVYRLLQFLEMVEMFRNVHEKDKAVRVLRRLRIVCFFLFYLLENSMLFLLRVEGLEPRDPRVKVFKRGVNGFWCLSILLAFPLDHLMSRNGVLSTVKKLLDLSVAYVAFSGHRVNDGVFSALGLASGNIGIYLRWIEVMTKFQAQARKPAAGDVE